MGDHRKAEAGVTMEEIAEACWSAVDEVTSDPVVLVGCSVGAWLAPYMEHLPRHGRWRWC